MTGQEYGTTTDEMTGLNMKSDIVITQGNDLTNDVMLTKPTSWKEVSLWKKAAVAVALFAGVVLVAKSMTPSATAPATAPYSFMSFASRGSVTSTSRHSLVDFASGGGLRDDLVNTRVFIENLVTERYVFPDGDPISGPRGSEGGWLASSGFEAPKMQGVDANYYNRAYFHIVPQGDAYLLVNEATDRFVFSDGEPLSGPRGSEGGWKESSGFEAPRCVGADANYYNRALWRIYDFGDKYAFVNVETDRVLFSDGEPLSGPRGSEGGWKASSGFEAPDIKGADANYYNRAIWKIEKV